MSVIKPTTIDFETDAIEGRPKYPPRPVGFAIQTPGDRKSRYYGWGHPVGNNCTITEAKRVLSDAWKSGAPLLFHNAKFDVDVAQTHMGVGRISWDRVHDTQFLLFLTNPHAHSLALKPSAEELLGMAPEERDVVRDWLVDHGIVKKNQRDWGAHIAKAPGDIVGKYADGDVERTRKLFQFLYPEVLRRGMKEAYDRERRLMPILLANEREGVRVDVVALRRDLGLYQNELIRADDWLRQKLRCKNLNVDSDEELAEALERRGVVTEWEITKTGKRSTAKKNMTPDKFNNREIASVLGYRNRLTTCIGTFMEKWLRMGEASGGLIFTNWNQVRQSSDGGFSGTRTGRMSTNPNFQNIPKAWDDKDDGYVPPTAIDLTPLPLMRKYILPDKGGVFCHRDYNQQEIRILSHFEDGVLMQAYNEDSRLDVHDFVKDRIAEISGLSLERRAVKVLNFGMIYGMGLGKLADGIRSSVEDAKRIKNAQLAAIPGLKELSKAISTRGRDGEAIRTWGGREYYTEPPKIINGRSQTFEYKLLNYLIQGSAADCTKEAIIRYHEVKQEGRFLVTVHDEINLSVPRAAVKREMQILRDVMQSVEFDVPMISDGKTGPNWASLKKFKE